MASLRPFRLIAILFPTLLAGACTLAETQVTSGGDFIAARPEWAARFEARPAGGSATGGVDRAVYDAARAEPLLRFPARIGLARIQHGALTSVPSAGP